ncbi:MAG: fumarylacetoacetate hydrolase family protein [Myxococcales bacterium]
MKLVRIQTSAGPRYAYARADGDFDLLGAAPWLGGERTGETFQAPGVLLTPVDPSKIVCVGRNYGAHARELGNQVPDEPLLFLKPPTALCGPDTAIELPEMSARVEHEAELGVVIGKRLKHASIDEVREAIFGLTCVNDVTARDLQRKEVQFTRAKGFDTFCPVGPHVESERLDLTNLSVSARVNGAQRQHGNTRDMVFPVLELVSFISRVMTLLPGDLVSTGTPEGVGPLARGDVVEIEVAGVGVLRNTVR